MAPAARLFLLFGGANAALGVMLGAFGAHALKARLPAELLAIYHTGVQYHLLHALGLIAVGLVVAQRPEAALLRWSGWLMLAGIVLFCGSLYLLALSGLRGLGAVAPVGGTAFILAWVLFAVGAFRAA